MIIVWRKNYSSINVFDPYFCFHWLIFYKKLVFSKISCLEKSGCWTRRLFGLNFQGCQTIFLRVSTRCWWEGVTERGSCRQMGMPIAYEDFFAFFLFFAFLFSRFFFFFFAFLLSLFFFLFFFAFLFLFLRFFFLLSRFAFFFSRFFPFSFFRVSFSFLRFFYCVSSFTFLSFAFHFRVSLWAIKCVVKTLPFNFYRQRVVF